MSAADGFAAELVGHLITAGGKRVRPGFCLVASRVFHGDSAPAPYEAVRGGAAVELAHIGSLYHDDVMDGAAMRRAVPSVNIRWGNRRAILAGDYLLGRASEISASLGSVVAGLLATTITRLCEGQIAELDAAFDVDRDERHYERTIAGKTAALLGTSCRIGAAVADMPTPAAEALEDFGRAYGMVFQIVDDILDVVATDSQLGKPAGNDMIEGIYTLPVIRALADPVAGERLRSILGRPIDAAERDEARGIVLSTTAVEQAQAEARSWAAEARNALSGLPGTPATGVLRHAAADLVARTDRLISGSGGV